MGSDDGWLPVERGDGRGAAAPPSEPEGFGPVQRPGEAEPAPLEGAGAGPGTGELEQAPAEPDHGGFGPPQRGRQRILPRPTGFGRPRRLGRPRGLGKAVLTGLLVVVLAVVGTGAALAVYTSLQINRTDVGGLGSASGQMNVLIVGNDSREGLTDEELLALGTEAVEGDRTDTIFLLSVSGGRAAMLSFPRDLFVTRCDGSSGRINGAYAAGGPTCLTQTVSEASGIPVTHYAEVNFLGFIGLVDAVGGVSLHFDDPFVDRPAGVDLPAGCQRLDGAQAIGYVRARTVDSDLGRITRQQRFVAELAEEVLSPATLVNVPRLFATGGAAGRSLTASHNLGTFDLLRLARAARGFAGSGLATYTVPTTTARVGGAAMLVADDVAAGELYGQFRDGSILQPPPEPEGPAGPAGGEPAGPAGGEPGAQPAPVPDPEAADDAPADC